MAIPPRTDLAAAPTGVRPLHIGLDGTCIAHGNRAIHRYVVSLVRCLVSLPPPHEYRLLRVNPSGELRAELRSRRLTTCDTRIPGRILFP